MTELVFRDDAYARECAALVTAVDGRGITLDRTVFYARGGGQPGDSGVLTFGDGAVDIVDAIKGDGDTVIHVPAEGAAIPPGGTEGTAESDWERRHKMMRMHESGRAPWRERE